MQIPVQQTVTTLQLWLAFATPVTVTMLGIIQVVVAKWARDSDIKRDKKIDDIHTFTNSALGAALRATALSLRALADTSRDPFHENAALRAEAESKAHDETQKRVNAGHA